MSFPSGMFLVFKYLILYKLISLKITCPESYLWANPQTMCMGRRHLLARTFSCWLGNKKWCTCLTRKNVPSRQLESDYWEIACYSQSNRLNSAWMEEKEGVASEGEMERQTLCDQIRHSPECGPWHQHCAPTLSFCPAPSRSCSHAVREFRQQSPALLKN